MDLPRAVQDYALSRAGVRSAFIKPSPVDDEIAIVMTVVCLVPKTDWIVQTTDIAIQSAKQAIDAVTQPVMR